MDNGERCQHMSERDDSTLLDLAVHVLETRRPEAVWPWVAQELARVLDGAAVISKDQEWTEDSGRVTVWRPGLPQQRTVTRQDTARCVRTGYPFAGHYATAPGLAPASAAQIVGVKQWAGSETASVLREAFGTRHMLGLPLKNRDSGLHGFVIHRDGQDFRTPETAYATRAQRLLTAAAAHSALLESLTPLDGPAGAAAHDIGLTPRQVVVLHLLGAGLSAHSIARRLSISERTVHKHLQNLYRRLDVNDRLSAVRRAEGYGLLKGVPQ